MHKSGLLKNVEECLLAFDRDGTRTAINKALDASIAPADVMKELKEGLDEIGAKYEKGEYFLSELIISGEIAKAALDVLTPHFAKGQQKLGKVVIGTVEGDIHDIGKNIVSTILLSSGYEVYDLGVDVKSSRFVTEIKERDADVLGLSALLTSTMMNMKTVILDLKKAGPRNNVKVIVGGAPLSESFAKEVGADAYVRDAPEILKTIDNLMEE
jgi:corrinoid protein of di/trimethylamine methyltransferase